MTSATHSMIAEKQLVDAKKGQVIINVGRGKLIDEEALVAALQCDIISGAALDVFAEEPLPTSSGLWLLPNVLISPHNADMVQNFRHKSVDLFVENCSRFLNEEELLNVVDVHSGY